MGNFNVRQRDLLLLLRGLLAVRRSFVFATKLELKLSERVFLLSLRIDSRRLLRRRRRRLGLVENGAKRSKYSEGSRLEATSRSKQTRGETHVSYRRRRRRELSTSLARTAHAHAASASAAATAAVAASAK